MDANDAQSRYSELNEKACKMAQETKEWKVLTVEDCIANLESLSANRA